VIAAAAAPAVDWRTANQAYLRAEFDAFKARLAVMTGSAEPSAVEAAALAAEEARSELPAPPAIDAVAAGFGLSAFERELLLLAAGVEADAELAQACGAVTFDLASALLPGACWDALAPVAPLRRWHLVWIGSGASLATAPIRIEERVLFHLTATDAVEPRLVSIVRAHEPGELVAGPHLETAAALSRDWEPSVDGWPVIQLVGDDPEGQEDVAAIAAAGMGWHLAVLRGEDVPALAADRDLLASLWTRESLLTDAALLIVDGGEGYEAASVADLLAAPTFVAGCTPVALRRPWKRLDVKRPSEQERRRLWRLALDAPDERDPALDALAGRFPVSARAIEGAAPVVAAALSSGADPVAAVRRRFRPGGQAPHALARHVEPVATWEDLVLPGAAVATLGEIAAQVRNRATVHEDWGFDRPGARGLGITALFTGESGTGKTLAAEVLANELALDLHVIDLSAVVSKYIGETEKNLRLVFDAAEDGAILLFDEADALFGRRTDVKDSHDRYANLEVSYLLQRMEAYRGLAILTTNAKTALDQAFRRRIRFVVSFPFPDSVLRERIWRGVFPPGTPLGRLDWARLASLDLSGGSIRSIAVNAAFLAADDGGRVRMQHIRAAARQEFAKLERPATGKRGSW
jgi:ATPase family associated with various cellular activities (AAA)